MRAFTWTIIVLGNCFAILRPAIAFDWVKLPSLKPTGDSLNMHSDVLMDPASMPIKSAQVPGHAADSDEILHRFGLAAQQQQQHNQHVAPIRYEDLEHIVGPGFEADLERFYEQHKHDIDESTRRSPRPPKDYVPEEDPWSIYDKPIRVQTTVQSINASVAHHWPLVFSGDRLSHFDSDASGKPTVVTFVSKPIADAAKKHTNTVFSQTLHVKPQFQDMSKPDSSETTPASPVGNKHNSSATKSTKRKVFKLIPVQIDQPAPSSSLFGFANLLQFFRKVQNSFVTNTSRSVQDKIKMLEQFRDGLLRNISESLLSYYLVLFLYKKITHLVPYLFPDLISI